MCSCRSSHCDRCNDRLFSVLRAKLVVDVSAWSDPLCVELIGKRDRALGLFMRELVRARALPGIFIAYGNDESRRAIISGAAAERWHVSKLWKRMTGGRCVYPLVLDAVDAVGWAIEASKLGQGRLQRSRRVG